MSLIKTHGSVRVGDSYPYLFDVDEKVMEGWISATAYLYIINAVQLLRKENQLALFLFEFGDEKIPPIWWRDAEVIWEWVNPNQTRRI